MRGVLAVLSIAVSNGFSESVTYEHIVRDEPVSLHIHVLRVDLQAPDVSLHVQVGPPPPSGIAGEVLMTHPLELAREADLDWAINTNPWRHPERGKPFPMRVGAPAVITGWAVSDGETRSDPCVHCWEFWIDRAGKAQVGNVDREDPERPDVTLAVGGFSGLLRDGEMIPDDPEGNRAPRSALGLDRDQRILTLVVVDKGVPAGHPIWREVMNVYELAELMRELGCWNACNLDGGGSSILVRRDPGTTEDPRWSPVNLQSAVWQRPLPMVLGVRIAE